MFTLSRNFKYLIRESNRNKLKNIEIIKLLRSCCCFFLLCRVFIKIYVMNKHNLGELIINQPENIFHNCVYAIPICDRNCLYTHFAYQT